MNYGKKMKWEQGIRCCGLSLKSQLLSHFRSYEYPRLQPILMIILLITAEIRRGLRRFILLFSEQTQFFSIFVYNWYVLINKA